MEDAVWRGALTCGGRSLARSSELWGRSLERSSDLWRTQFGEEL